MNLNENIRKARLEAGLSQKELANLLKVTQKDVCRWETGDRLPSIPTLKKICSALNISADSLLELNTTENKN